MKINRKIITILIILIAVINIILSVLLFIKDIAWEFYTNSFIAIVTLQIIAIISSVIVLKYLYSKKAKVLMILSTIILLITFFIPIQLNLDGPSSVGGVSPTVMPKECKQNIYKITIWSNY